ncbi:MAG: pitrilysin family protein, partial [Gluconobacter potus]|uniref:M16 family metallopeptidase n=1 Tax=Gluconobacter potus TaxID=2724927 RepID=UPI0039EA2E56
GKLNHQQVVDLVKDLFRDLQTHQTPRPRAAAYEGGELRTTRELDQAHLVMGFPSVSYMHPDHYAVMILSTLLGGGMSSRLFQEIRERRGLVYSVYSFASPFSDSGLFGLYAGTGEEQTAELVPVMIDELKRLQDGLSAEELSRARAQLKSSLLMSLESTGSRCEQLARQIQVHNRPVPTAETVGKIDAVTEADILRVARTIFSGTPTFTAIGPVGNMPSLEDITARLAA